MMLWIQQYVFLWWNIVLLAFSGKFRCKMDKVNGRQHLSRNKKSTTRHTSKCIAMGVKALLHDAIFRATCLTTLDLKHVTVVARVLFLKSFCNISRNARFKTRHVNEKLAKIAYVLLCVCSFFYLQSWQEYCS